MSNISQVHKVIFENQKVKNPELKVELKNFFNRFPDFEKYITNAGTDIMVRNYVGVIGTKNYKIEILPKIWRKSQDEIINFNHLRDNFFILFSYAFFRPPFFEPYLKLLEKKKIDNLRDFTLMLFSNTLFDETRKGIYKNYVKEHATSKYLKGKLEVRKHIIRPNKSLFDVETHNFNGDNKLNQIFEWSLEEFLKTSNDVRLRKQLLQMSGIFKSEYVKSLKYNDLTYSFNRINDRFEIPYNYACILLENKTAVSGGNKKEMMFLYDMNKIYEKFLFNFIYRNKLQIFGTNKVKLEYDKGHRNMLLDPLTNKKRFMTKPDIRLKLGHLTLILDAKNKENDNQLINGIKREDLYQMHAYSHSYDADSILYYPSAAEDHDPIQGPYRFHENSNHNLWVSTINLDFSGEKMEWENRMIANLKEDFDIVVNHLTK